MREMNSVYARSAADQHCVKPRVICAYFSFLRVRLPVNGNMVPTLYTGVIPALGWVVGIGDF